MTVELHGSELAQEIEIDCNRVKTNRHRHIEKMGIKVAKDDTDEQTEKESSNLDVDERMKEK